ncbi:MAG: AI-2E family transporter [Syntrophales bacterium]|nr:AI-2E family transporter [Syntrophales bacterium]
MNTDKKNITAFLIILGIITVIFILLLRPFILPMIWATIIVSILQPFYRHLLKRDLTPNQAAIIMVITTITIIIIPLATLGSLLLAESLNLYNSLEMDVGELLNRINETLSKGKTYFPFSSLKGDLTFLKVHLTEILKHISNFLWQNLKSITQNTVIFVVQFAIMIYTLFFLFRDGQNIREWIMHRLPLSEPQVKILHDRFRATALATIKVTLIIGGVQGLIGSLLFFALNIKGALTWGVLMMGTSIIPGVGSSIVWIPAGIIMIIMGHLWKGLAILIVGFMIISMIDNMLRPTLLGQDVQMHPLLIFLSTLGGINLFGLSGFVLGPIIASLFVTFWNMYTEVFTSETLPLG